MAQSNIVERQRESPAGYHFYWSYLNNPREWYLKYVIGLKPTYTAPALIQGGAMHHAWDVYHRAGMDAGTLIPAFTQEVEARRGEVESEEAFEKVMRVGSVMLDHWLFETAPQYAERFEVLESEQPYEFHIGPSHSFLFTVRPDVIVRDKRTGRVHVVDRKTSSWGLQAPIKQAQCEDQITSYIWAMRKAHPDWNVQDAMIDVVFVRENKTGMGSPQACISDPIYRSKTALLIFELNIVGLIAEITQKVQALRSGIPWPLLFGIDGRADGIFGSPYHDLMRTDIRPTDPVPPGFVRDDWTGPLDDLIAVASIQDFDGFRTLTQE